MKTSSRFAVAIHVLAGLLIAKKVRNVDILSSEKIAKSVNTNPVVIRRILGRLRKAGLVQSVPGAVGGTMLAKDMTKVTLLDVFKAVEDEGLFGCHWNEPNKQCLIGGHIMPFLKKLFGRAESAALAVFAEKTIDDVASELMAEANPFFK